MIFTATTSPVTKSRALCTLPYDPSPDRVNICRKREAVAARKKREGEVRAIHTSREAIASKAARVHIVKEASRLQWRSPNCSISSYLLSGFSVVYWGSSCAGEGKRQRMEREPKASDLYIYIRQN
jgi:hypothetical protein